MRWALIALWTLGFVLGFAHAGWLGSPGPTLPQNLFDDLKWINFRQANVNILIVDTKWYSPPIAKLSNLRTFSFILFCVKSRLFLLIP